MRISLMGLLLSCMYVLPAVACVGLSLFNGDPKSSFIYLQLPIILQLAALQSMGAGEWLSSLSWAGSYVLLGIPLALTLYFFGHWLGGLFTDFCKGE